MLGSSHIDTSAYASKLLSVRFNSALGKLKVKDTHTQTYAHTFWLRYLWIATLLALAPLEHIMAFLHIHAQAHEYKQAAMRHEHKFLLLKLSTSEGASGCQHSPYITLGMVFYVKAKLEPHFKFLDLWKLVS